MTSKQVDELIALRERVRELEKEVKELGLEIEELKSVNQGEKPAFERG